MDTPYLEREVACPICGVKTVHYYLKDHTYVVDKRDEIGFITRYHWVKPEFERFNLYYFYLWHCPKCWFTDHRTTFLRGAKGKLPTSFIDFKKRFLAHRESSAFLKFINRYIQYPAEDLLSQLNLHFLATYIQLIPDPHNRDQEKIARLYLRIAWLYRLGQNVQKDEKMEAALQTFFEQYELFRTHLLNALHLNENLMNWMEEELAKQANASIYSLWLPFAQSFRKHYQTIANHFDPIIEATHQYHQLSQQMKKLYAQMFKNPLTLPFHQFASYQDFLAELQHLWSDLPVSESAAHHKALQFLREIITYRLYENDVGKMFNVFKIMIILNERLEEYTLALDYCRKLKERLEAITQRIQKRIDDWQGSTAGQEELSRFKSGLLRLQKMRDEIRLLEKRILEKKIESDEKIANDIFMTKRDLDAEALRYELEQAGLEASVIDKFVQARKQEKKKGIFQLFRL